jgi:hypothetical protein
MVMILVSILVMWILCRILWPRQQIQPSQMVVYTPAITINVYVERSHGR